MFRRVVDALITAVAILFIVPTILVLASWNAVPGDRLYSLKSGLEDITLLVLSGTPLVPEVSIKFTDRRFSEATTLLANRGSTAGYSLLVAEAQQTQGYIYEKKDSQSSEVFVQKIENYQEEIQKSKDVVIAQIQSGETPQKAPTQQPPKVFKPAQPEPVAQDSQTVTVNVPETIIIKEEEPEEVLASLEEAQAQLEEIKEDVELKMPKGESEKTDFKKDDDKKDEDKDEKDKKENGSGNGDD